MKCTHEDCFTCPYDDCISDKSPVSKKRGRKKLPPEVVRQHRLAYQRKYNKEHKEKLAAQMKKYYQEHKEYYKSRRKK